MALPPSEELSRWTVGHVSKWLAKCSLAVFRDDFLRDSIDGSRLMRLKPHEVNEKYKHISSKKRNILIDNLNKIECKRPPPTWSVAPHLPPRPGGGSSRTAPPPPPQTFDDSGESDGGWSDFEDDYLEPASKPLDCEPSSGYNTNGNAPPKYDGPEENYEIQEEDLEEIRRQPAGGEPPPRPPRSMEKRSEALAAQSTAAARHHSPRPNILPSEDAYEAMNDVITETQFQKTQKSVHQFPVHVADQVDLPPRPGARGPRGSIPDLQPAARSAQRPREPYQVVKKPGRQAQEDELSKFDWYHGKIGRDHAQKVFQREQKDGMFLIRKSERDPKQPYTLMLWYCGRIWNIPIRKKDNGKFAAGKNKDGESEFTAVSGIVDHFKVASLSLRSNDNIRGSHSLTVPAPKH